MKKIVLNIAFIFGLMVIVTSCVSDKFTVKDDGGYSYSTGMFALGSGSYKYTINEEIPIEQCAVITFARGPSFVVLEYNGIDIKKNIYGNKNPSNKDETVLTIPGGNNKITFDVSILSGSTIHTMKSMEVPYNFEQGKLYKFTGEAKSQGFLKSSELLLKLSDVTAGTTVLKEWNLTEMFKK